MADPIIKLRDEIQNDPEALGYAGKTDQEITDILNTKNRNFNKPVPSTEILAWSGGNARYMKIKNTSEDTQKSDAIRSIAYAALRTIERDGTAFDVDKADRMEMLDALVSDGTLDASDKTALTALAAKTDSRAVELGVVAEGDEVALGHVKQAKSLI